MSRILIAITAYNASWSVREQLRLLDTFLGDPHQVYVFDNSTDLAAAAEIRDVTLKAGAIYTAPRVGSGGTHIEALNAAASLFRVLDTPGGGLYGQTGADVTHLLWCDHDVYLTGPAVLAPLIDQAGFLAIRQRHPATGVTYPWPGFLAVSRGWVNGRALNFDGIRGAEKRDDGDTGSMLWPIFDVADWSRLPVIEHGYRQLREPDDHLQSWAYEYWKFGNSAEWRHATNLSRWLAVPNPDERERLVREMVEVL